MLLNVAHEVFYSLNIDSFYANVLMITHSLTVCLYFSLTIYSFVSAKNVFPRLTSVIAIFIYFLFIFLRWLACSQFFDIKDVIFHCEFHTARLTCCFFQYIHMRAPNTYIKCQSYDCPTVKTSNNS